VSIIAVLAGFFALVVFWTIYDQNEETCEYSLRPWVRWLLGQLENHRVDRTFRRGG